MIASDDDAARKEEEEGEGDDSRQGSVEGGRTATATALDILVCLLCGVVICLGINGVGGLLGIVIRSSDGLKREEKKERR